MDATTLSRIQFGVSVGFHFLFPATTLGLTLIILVLESLWLKTRDGLYREISVFLTKIFSVIFVMGVATGLTLSLSFGTNWAGFSKTVGAVFALPVAIEAVTAFGLESLALGLLLFGRRRVSAGLYWLAACLVFFGAHFSGFWIVAANSWMHTPAGFELKAGIVRLTDFGLAVFNPTTLIRFLHTVAASWLCGALFAGAVAAWYLLKARHVAFARRLLGLVLPLLVLLPLAQLALGHTSAVAVDEWEPVKSAAMEGIFSTQPGAPLLAFGLPDQRRRTVHFPIGLPGMLSFLLTGDFGSTVKGLNDYPESDWPPVEAVFTSFHLMVAAGMLLVVLGLAGAWLHARGRLFSSRRFHKLLILALPLPYIAVETGWMAAEMGRQPWIVTGLLRTDQAASAALPAGQVLLTLGLLSLIYAFLFFATLRIVLGLVKRGPTEGAEHD